MARTGTWILTWGDANALPDEPIAPAQIIGVIGDVPSARWLLRRAMIVRYLTARSPSFDVLTRRVALVYRVRAVWREGPVVFVRTALRALFRRLSMLK